MQQTAAELLWKTQDQKLEIENLKFWRGVGAAERAALEMLCTVYRTAGSNPALSVTFAYHRATTRLNFITDEKMGLRFQFLSRVQLSKTAAAEIPLW